MTDVGKVTIETVPAHNGLRRHISGTVNVGGSLVVVEGDDALDPELARIIADLDARLAVLAVETVRASLHEE